MDEPIYDTEVGVHPKIKRVTDHRKAIVRAAWAAREAMSAMNWEFTRSLLMDEATGDWICTYGEDPSAPPVRVRTVGEAFARACERGLWKSTDFSQLAFDAHGVNAPDRCREFVNGGPGDVVPVRERHLPKIQLGKS